MIIIKGLLLASLLASLTEGAQLPSDFTRCEVSQATDGGTNECVAQAVAGAVRSLAAGAPDLALGPLDPLHIARLRIDQGVGPITIQLTFTDCALAGIKDISISELKGNFSSPSVFHIKAKGLVPHMVLSGPYAIKGKVLVLPIQGNGTSVMNLDGVNAEVMLKGNAETRDGQEYLNLTQLKVKLKGLSRLHFNFENLFNGDKDLGDNMNTFLNENWGVIYDELRPNIQESFSSVFYEYAKKFFQSIPYKDIFIIV